MSALQVMEIFVEMKIVEVGLEKVEQKNGILVLSERIIIGLKGKG